MVGRSSVLFGWTEVSGFGCQVFLEASADRYSLCIYGFEHRYFSRSKFYLFERKTRFLQSNYHFSSSFSVAFLSLMLTQCFCPEPAVHDVMLYVEGVLVVVHIAVHRHLHKEEADVGRNNLGQSCHHSEIFYA